jgi:hypothetical protein
MISPSVAPAGTRIGVYEITGQVGEGGMEDRGAAGGAVEQINVIVNWLEETKVRVPAR